MIVNGKLISYDNRRLSAAQQAELSGIPIEIVNPSANMPNSAKTWKQAFDSRRNDQRNVREGGAVPEEGLVAQPKVVEKEAQTKK